MAKKIRRRRSAPTPKSQGRKTTKKKTKKKTKKVPSLQDKEQQSERIKDVVPKVYQRTGMDRLNSIPDYTTTMKENRIETIVANFYAMNEVQLKKVAQDPHATILEKTLLQMFQESMDPKNKQKNEISKYLHSRMAGQPKKHVEFSGGVEQQLQFSTKQVPDFDNMTDEELEQYEAALKNVQSLPLKEIKVEDEK